MTDTLCSTLNLRLPIEDYQDLLKPNDRGMNRETCIQSSDQISRQESSRCTISSSLAVLEVDRPFRRDVAPESTRNVGRLPAGTTRPAFLLQRACPFSCLHVRVESRNGASSTSPREDLDSSASSPSRFPTARRTTGARSNPRDRPSLREGTERLPCRCRLLRIPNLLGGNP